MTLEEKIATKPELERIDSSIESCFKILNQELNKRLEKTPAEYSYIRLITAIKELQQVEYWFNQVKGRKE